MKLLYVISQVIPPKVLLLRDIPTLRTLLFIFGIGEAICKSFKVKLTQWYSEHVWAQTVEATTALK